MATIYDRTWVTALESVTTGFDSVSNADGDMARNAGTSPLDGSTGYVTVLVDDQTANFGLIDLGLLGSGPTKFRHNHMMDFNTLALATDGQSVRIFNWQSTDGSQRACSITLIRLSGALNVRLTAINDDNLTTSDADTILSGTPEWFELEVTKATGISANDGVYKLWIGGGDYPAGGSLIATISGRDIWTFFETLDKIRLGATNIGTGISGTFSLDRARGTDAGEAILVVDNTAPTITAQASKRMVYGVANAIAFTVADVDDDALTVDVGCTTGTLTAPLAAGAGVTVVSGSGTNALALSGTVAQFTSMGSISYTQSGYTNDTITWDVDDGTVGGTQDTTTVTMETAKFYGGDLANLNAVLVTLGVTADEVGSFTLRMTSVDSGGNTDVDIATVTVGADIPGGGQTGSGPVSIWYRRRRRRR